MLRETWERIVEEVLFADVIGRFRPDVQTRKLRAACLDERDREAIFNGMSRCSVHSGHDAPIGTPPDLPRLDEILEDFNALELYFTMADARRGELEKQGKKREAGPSVAEVL